MSFRYAAGINKPGFDPLAAGVDQYKGIWNISSQANAKGANTWPVPFTVPGAPTIGVATATGSTTATVTYTAPASDGGTPITLYTATSSPGGITGTLAQAGSGTVNVTGLTSDTSYTFTVTATNIMGVSSASAASNSITTDALLQLWSWGRNNTGQLGIGNTTYYSSPKQVGALATWLNIAAGYNFSMATQTDKTFYTWGSN